MLLRLVGKAQVSTTTWRPLCGGQEMLSAQRVPFGGCLVVVVVVVVHRPTRTGDGVSATRAYGGTSCIHGDAAAGK